MCVYVCACACIRLYVYVCVYVCVYVYLHVYVNVIVHVYLYDDEHHHDHDDEYYVHMYVYVCDQHVAMYVDVYEIATGSAFTIRHRGCDGMHRNIDRECDKDLLLLKNIQNPNTRVRNNSFTNCGVTPTRHVTE